jgi:hypothetical protein
MNMLVVQSKIKEEHVADAEAAVAKFFQELEQAQLDVRYAVGKLSDGVTITAYLEIEEGAEHPLRAFPAYTAMLENLKPWQDGPPAVDRMKVIDSYRLF